MENFPGDNPDEDLSFKKGQWIELIDTSDEDWWNGRRWDEGHATKETGNFPVDLVEKRKRPQWTNGFLNKTVYQIPASYSRFLEGKLAKEAAMKKAGMLAPPGAVGEGKWWSEMEDDEGNPYWYGLEDFATTYEDPFVIPTPPASPRLAPLGPDQPEQLKYVQITMLEDGSRYWYETETKETTWVSPYDPRDPPERWHNNFANGDFYWVDYENVRTSMEKPQDLQDWEDKLERNRVCLELMWGDDAERGKLERYPSREDYLVDMVERNVHCKDAIKQMLDQTEVVQKALRAYEVVSVVADLVRRVECIAIIDSMAIKLEEQAEVQRMAALQQAGDDDPNDRDLEPEWLDLYTIPQSVPYVEKFALRDWYERCSGPLWIVDNGWREFNISFQKKMKVENRYKIGVAKLEEKDSDRFNDIEDRVRAKKISATQARWQHEERQKKLEDGRETLKTARAQERQNPELVPHKFYSISDVATWYGTVCKNGHVVGVNLNKNDVEGKIPKNIMKLSHLVSLCLNRNRLVGTLPEAILELHSLKTLDLNGNQFTGIIPSAVSQLTNLQFLYLQKNNFYGPIANLCTLTAVKVLNISENNFGTTSGFPPVISKLKRLEKLDVSHNNLVGFFHEKLCRLTRLKELRIDGNDITGVLPDTICKLVDLQVLAVDHNRMYGIVPEKIKKMKTLERLWLGSNKFSGTIPEWLPKLKKLTTLDLHDNNFSGYMLPTLAQLTKLEILRLDFNYFEGNVPRSYARLVKLVEFDVGNGAIGNNQGLENLPVTLATLEEWRRTKPPPLKEELPYDEWLKITLGNVKELRHSRREEISQGEAHKLVRNRRAFEKLVDFSRRDNRTNPPLLRPLRLQTLFNGGAPTNTRNDGEGRPDGWIPEDEDELKGVIGWTPGYPTVLPSDLNKTLLFQPKEEPSEEASEELAEADAEEENGNQEMVSS